MGKKNVQEGEVEGGGIKSTTVLWCWKGGELRQVKPKLQTCHCPQIMFCAVAKWWQTKLILMVRRHEGGVLGLRGAMHLHNFCH